MSTALFVTMVLVVDIWVARDLLLNNRGNLTVYGLGFMPMATALALGIYRIGRLGERADGFTRGFVAASLLVSGVYLTAMQKVPAVRDFLGQLAEALDGWLTDLLPLGSTEIGKVLTASEWLTAAMILSLPTFLAAIGFGLAARSPARSRGVVGVQVP